MAKRSVPKSAKERIVDAATVEFAHLGFHGARLARIAKRAKVSSQLLYHYFQSKQGLYHTILESSLNQIPFPSTLTSEFESMELWFRSTASWHGDLHLRLVLWEALENKDRRYAAEVSRRDAIVAGIETFRLAQEKGEISRSFDPFFLYMTFTGLNGLPKIFPQMPSVLGINPVDPEFLGRWHKHLVMVAQAMGCHGIELGSGEGTSGASLPVAAAVSPASSEKTYTLEEVHEIVDEVISKVSGREAEKRK